MTLIWYQSDDPLLKCENRLASGLARRDGMPNNTPGEPAR